MNIACNSEMTCYVGCSCKEENGWYSDKSSASANGRLNLAGLGNNLSTSGAGTGLNSSYTIKDKTTTSMPGITTMSENKHYISVSDGRFGTTCYKEDEEYYYITLHTKFVQYFDSQDTTAERYTDSTFSIFTTDSKVTSAKAEFSAVERQEDRYEGTNTPVESL